MQLRTLRYPRYVPPGGAWFYRIEPAGINIESRQSIDDVVDQAARFYRANSQPVPENLRALVEDHMCQHLPSGNCIGPDGRPQYEVQPNFFEVLKVLEDTFRGKTVKHCTLAEAEDRVKTCIPCVRHNHSLCTGCDGLRQSSKNFVKGRTTRFDGRTGVCTVYRLPVAALVHIDNPGIRDGRPETCWVRDA